MPALNMPDPPTRVIQEPLNGTVPMAGAGIGNIIISVASAADAIPAWGAGDRDKFLRTFWPTEYAFASALFTTVAQYCSFGYTLSGPPRSVRIAQEVLSSFQFGKGWEGFFTPVLIDYFTQDNGAFIEIVRTDDDFRAPVITLNHLDSQKCTRTGRHEEPVIYTDSRGKNHLLKWYNVVDLTEFPAPVESALGKQYCVLTRIMRAAQIIRDISIVKSEKAGGRFTRQVHLVSGVQSRIIEDAMKQKQSEADAAGLMRYVQPLIVASLDPTARVTKETIDLASVPEDWDEEKSLQSYITMLAMAFGSDYQNFAPLPGGGLGSSSQSKILNMKSRGKGPGLFMRKVERLFNFHGLLPSTVTLTFGEHDAAEQMERAELRKSRAEYLEILTRASLITPEVGRQILVDNGDLDERYLMMMREENATDDVRATSTEPHEQPDKDDVKPGTPAPKQPIQNIPRPPNSNAKLPRNPANNQRRTPGGTPEAGARA